MKNHLIPCLFLVFSAVLQAQTVLPDIKKDLALPVLFSSDSQQQLLFYSNKSIAGNTFAFQVAVLDSFNQLLKLYPLQTLNIFPVGEKRLDHLCSYSDHTRHYALYKCGTSIYRISFEGDSQQLSAALLGTLPAEEELLGVFPFESGPLVLTRGHTGKKNYNLYLYRLVSGVMKKTTVKGYLPDFLQRKNYRPLLVTSGVDMRPDDAIASEKIFTEGQKIYFTYEKTPNIYSNDVLDLQLATLDLQTDSLQAEVVHFPNKGIKVAGASGASYIFEGKLFQVYYDEKRFGLLVSSLPEHKMLFERFISAEDSLTLLNSPVFLPRYLIPELTQKVSKASRLIRSMQALKPYIYVKNKAGEYLIGLGGYEKEQRYPAVGMASGNTSVAIGGIYYYENTASFYSILKGSAQELSAHRMDETVLSKLNAAGIPENGEFINLDGQSKYMYLKSSTGQEGKAFYMIGLPGY